MTGRVRRCPEAGLLARQPCCAKRQDPRLGLGNIVYADIQMDLLRKRRVRPLRRPMTCGATVGRLRH